MNINKTLSIACFVLLAFLTETSLDAYEHDLLNAALKKEDSRESVEAGYYRLLEVLTPYNDGALFKLPPKKGSVNRISIPAIKVKGSTRYTLDWKIIPRHFMDILLYASFENPRNGKDPLFHVFTFSNSSSFMRMEKDIITPPDATSMTLQIFLSGKDIAPNATLGFIKSMKIRESGNAKMAKELEACAGKNMLKVANFESFEVGEKNLSKLGLFTAFNQKPYSAEVIKDESGRNVLKVRYVPGDYQYMAWYTPGIMKFQGASGIMKYRIRGKGKIQLMTFIGRPQFHTIYQHYGFFELPSDWQEYSVGIGCDDPLAQSIAATIACRDNETEFEISDISFTLTEIK